MSNRIAIEPNPTESIVTNKIFTYLEKYKKLGEMFLWKEHGGMYGTAGIPDIITIFRGNFIAFEVKRPKGGKVTNLQCRAIEKIRAAGGYAFVVHSVEEVQTILNLEVFKRG